MIECANKDKLITCKGCGAIYDKTLSWYRGFYDRDTADEFTPVATVKENCCPICNKENK